jgi:hypothetical protein
MPERIAGFIDGRFPNSFPRSAWECRLRRSASSSFEHRRTKTTRSVEDGIPTEDRGNEDSEALE